MTVVVVVCSLSSVGTSRLETWDWK